MSQRLKVFYLNIFLIFCSIKSIQASCRIYYPQYAEIRPTLYKYFGSHKVEISPNANNYVQLNEGQEMEAHCDIDFESPKENTNHLYFKCNNYLYRKSIMYSTYDSREYSSDISLSCSNLKWNLYESSQNFLWCPSNVTSYILAKPKYTYSKIFDYLAGICYDIYNFSLKSVYYTLAPGRTKFAEPSVLVDFYKPSLELKYFTETFGTNSISEIDFTNEQFKTWITLSNYKFSSIIQHSKLYSTFNGQFKSIIEFVWWSNLRSFNWNYYKLALESHVEKENQIYDILAGVSDAIKVPYLEDCQTNLTMKEIIDDKNRKIPMYVWNYLMARDNSTNDLVIIGFNSPFNEFYSEKDVIFCPDKCQEIPWLKNASLNFRRSIMGIVFCCNFEDVKASKRLNGFPEIDMKTKPSESVSSATPASSATLASSGSNELLDDVAEDNEEY